MSKSIGLAIRSKVIWHTAGAMNWVSEHIGYKDLNAPVGPRDRLRWWIEGRLSRIFGWAWNGSREEIEAVYHSEVPLYAMSARQRAVLTLPREEYGAHCVHCRWHGGWNECAGDNCPECGKGVYLDELNKGGLAG